MINCNWEKTFIKNGNEIIQGYADTDNSAYKNTMSYKILSAHNTSGNMESLKIKFDALTSHDITYVGIIQTARASGLKEFPVPYALTNCHNSLCAVGGTLNEDDHIFGYTAARKYGGIFVPPHIAVIHSYAREELAGCGKMVLGSDSHTRYGALGCMAVGEGGPELVKQLLSKTYDINYPEVIAVMLKGAPKPGVGPHDVAISLIKEVFAGGYVKNKVLEFIGDGIANLSVDYRCGIDVMTTETTCLSSIWATDEAVRDYYKTHKREQDYKELKPEGIAGYDGLVVIELDKIEPMIALPFHPSNAYTIREFKKNAKEILTELENATNRQYAKSGIKSCLTDKLINGEFYVDQGVIAGCAGGIFENIMAAADILKGADTGNGKFGLSVYPASQSVYYEIVNNGGMASLMEAGAVIKTAFCGPCFGAGDVPAHNAFSIRHCTRNFPNREGSKPGDGQISYCALMDARSIAATAANGGKLTGADEIEATYNNYSYKYHDELYQKRVYKGFGQAHTEEELVLGPNIADWPDLHTMPDNLLLRLCSVIRDKVTTTDELIPSGETSTLRSNPYKLSEYALSRKDPAYVGKSKAVRGQQELLDAGNTMDDEYIKAARKLDITIDSKTLGVGSAIYANMPGDGSAREQAASCQKVLGGWANIALEYATKRYRSNLINWGMVPFIIDEKDAKKLSVDNFIYVPDIKNAILNKAESVQGYVLGKESYSIMLYISAMTDDERDILVSGGLINYYSR